MKLSIWLKAQRGKVIFFLGALALLALYFALVRPAIGPAAAGQVELPVLAGLALAVMGALVVGLVLLVSALWAQSRAGRVQRAGGWLVAAGLALTLLVALVAASQIAAYTPPILAENGEPLPGSIAEMEEIRLGGVDQWLFLRGQDVDKPVLLFLSGGPGGTEAGRVIRFNRDLEKDFVVAIWEQRGCGKSYPSINPRSAMTIEQYVADTIELSEYLRTRFDEQKIYLVGHSWGTIIGVRAVQQRPDLYHAYVGTAQMVNVLEADQIIYEKVLEHYQQTGNDRGAQAVQALGKPPYPGDNTVFTYANLFQREYEIFEMGHVKNEEFRREGDAILMILNMPEYGWLDRVNTLRALMDTFNLIYPQMQDIEFRQEAPRFELPVYIMSGRHDVNAPTELSEDYFNRLEAPAKRLDYFEDSGHGMLWEEGDKFYDLMVNTVLAETYPAAAESNSTQTVEQ